MFHLAMQLRMGDKMSPLSVALSSHHRAQRLSCPRRRAKIVTTSDRRRPGAGTQWSKAELSMTGRGTGRECYGNCEKAEEAKERQKRYLMRETAGIYIYNYNEGNDRLLYWMFNLIVSYSFGWFFKEYTH